MLDDWSRVKAVFEQALALPKGDRPTFLLEACGTDTLLRKHVEALLASHEAGQSFLEQPASAVLALPLDNATGQTAGTYQLLSRIAAGAMGEVYLAHDTNLDRRVAVKLIATGLAGDSDRLRRFRQEARAASSLNHPNIVVVHDFGELNGRPFIVTELVEGMTLRERLREGALPIRDAIDVALQVTSALAAAHARDLVHRDIKPENVMLRPDGYIKVLDFGLAKLAPGEATPDTASTSATKPGQAAGTPAYMSPEQARAEHVDARTDVFSVGALLYEMVTGRIAFSGDSHAVIFARLLGHVPTPPTTLNPALPPEVERIIAKALEKDRELRYQSMADMRADLLRLRRESDAELSALQVKPGPDATHRAVLSLNRRALATIAAVMLALSLVGFATLRSRDESAASVRPTRTMLAVLPFENLSEDERQEYFADGLTQELIAQLGQVQPARLAVISRTSTVRYKYKQKSDTAAQIGRELGVDYLLEGSVRRVGERVRVTAQLVHALEQTQLWSETYERPVTDVLNIQREIADHLTRSLSIQLLPARARGAAPRPVNFESYDKYLLGLHQVGKGTREGGGKAIEYFKDALAIDPDNARIHAALAQAYTAVNTYYSSPRDVMPMARDAALHAVALDPELDAAHVTLGNVRLLFDWDWPAAERAYRRALDINPNSPAAHLGYATYLATLGRFDEAIARVQQGYRFDPLALESRNEALWIYYFSGRMQETIEQCRKTIELEPAAGLPYAILALAHAHLGQRKEAIEAADNAVRLADSPTVITTTASALARIGQRTEARQLLNRSLALARERYVCRFIVAATYVDLGEPEQAFESLERAYLQRST